MKNSARSNFVFQCQVGNLCSTFRLLGFFVHTKLTWRTLCKQTGHEYAKQSPDTAATNTYGCTSSIHFECSPFCLANLSSVCWPCAGAFTDMLQMHVLEVKIANYMMRTCNEFTCTETWKRRCHWPCETNQTALKLCFWSLSIITMQSTSYLWQGISIS